MVAGDTLLVPAGGPLIPGAGEAAPKVALKNELIAFRIGAAGTPVPAVTETAGTPAPAAGGSPAAQAAGRPNRRTG